MRDLSLHSKNGQLWCSKITAEITSKVLNTQIVVNRLKTVWTKTPAKNVAKFPIKMSVKITPKMFQDYSKNVPKNTPKYSKNNDTNATKITKIESLKIS